MIGIGSNSALLLTSVFGRPSGFLTPLAADRSVGLSRTSMKTLPADPTTVPGRPRHTGDVIGGRDGGHRLLTLTIVLLLSGCTNERRATPTSQASKSATAAAPSISVLPPAAAAAAPAPSVTSGIAEPRARPSGDAPRVDFEIRKTKGRIHTYVSYPKLTYQSVGLSAAVNTRLRRLVEHQEKEFQGLLRHSDPADGYVSLYVVRCSVAYASDQLLSIGCDTYVFDGGAHGVKSYSMLDLLLPSLRELRITDIIRTDAESRKTLFEMCNAALIQAAKNAGNVDEIHTLDEPWASVKFNTFTITQKGLKFFFKDQLPHVVADAVIPEVTWAALEPLLKKSGHALPVDASRPFVAVGAPVHPWGARAEEDGE